MRTQPLSPPFSSNYVRLDRILCSRISVLQADFSFIDKGGRKHTAQAGMIFDGGSIPRLLWRVIDDPYGNYLAAYVIHDWYCNRCEDLTGLARFELRKMADNLFEEMLAALGCSAAKRKLMHAGVRLGGLWTQFVSRRKA